MHDTRSEAEEFIKENDVKFIRLAFCDVFGNQKNISIQTCELARAFECGIEIDSAGICGFEAGEPELFLVPDASTMSLLPWRPSQGRVVRFFCEIRKANGSAFELDSRRILANASKKLLEKGLISSFGAKCEFYLFKTDEDGRYTDTPFDNGTYLDIAPEDRGENVRREICLTLEEMGITPETSHHEAGPGQNEIDFQSSNPLTSADNVTTLKSVVKTVANLNGAHAEFSPKPIENRPGSSFHISVSLRSSEGGCADGVFESFTAGVLSRIRETTLFFNCSEESYRRLGRMKAPKYVSWAKGDRSQLIRIPTLAAGDSVKRFELRSPDCLSNPYIAYTLIICAGLEGVEKGLTLPESAPKDLHLLSDGQMRGFERLPESLSEAAMLAKNSSFVSEILPEALIEAYVSNSASEASRS